MPGIAYYFPQTDLISLCRILNFLCCRGTYSSCRIVYYPSESLLVIGIHHHSEIGYNILNLLSLVERQTAIYPIWNCHLYHLLLKRTALRVCPIQNDKVIIVAIILFLYSLYFITYDDSLFFVTVCRLIKNLISFVILAIHIFRYLAFIVFDKTVSRSNDMLRTAIIAFEFEKPGCREILLEVKDIIYVCPSKGIYALSVIANHANLSLPFGQLHHYTLLGIVRVLILINKHKVETLLIFPQNIFFIPEKQIGIYEQIIEIHCISLPQTGLICCIYVVHIRHSCFKIPLQGTSVHGIILGRNQVVFCHRYAVVHR